MTLRSSSMPFVTTDRSKSRILSPVSCWLCLKFPHRRERSTVIKSIRFITWIKYTTMITPVYSKPPPPVTMTSSCNGHCLRRQCPRYVPTPPMITGLIFYSKGSNPSLGIFSNDKVAIRSMFRHYRHFLIFLVLFLFVRHKSNVHTNLNSSKIYPLKGKTLLIIRPFSRFTYSDLRSYSSGLSVYILAIHIYIYILV